ncbi:MAG: OmpW/AlkL family protein [Alcanivorax sp.]|jgi:outer membrane protein
MKFTSKVLLMAGVAGIAMASLPAQAKDLGDGYFAKERFQVRLRAIGILADGDGVVENTTLDTDADNAYAPEIDITYFFTEHVAAELIAATAKHTVSAGGNNLGDTWVLPPTLTLQYHFTPDNKFSPYVGAGINYTVFYGEDDAPGFTDFNVGNGFGLAVQAGFDYWINDNWGLNLDAKYIDLNVDASVNNGGLNAYDVDINPWVIGAGVSYRF